MDFLSRLFQPIALPSVRMRNTATEPETWILIAEAQHTQFLPHIYIHIPEIPTVQQSLPQDNLHPYPFHSRPLSPPWISLYSQFLLLL
jgi:hypothetical protein